MAYRVHAEVTLYVELSFDFDIDVVVKYKNQTIAEDYIYASDIVGSVDTVEIPVNVSVDVRARSESEAVEIAESMISDFFGSADFVVEGNFSGRPLSSGEVVEVGDVSITEVEEIPPEEVQEGIFFE